MRRGSPLDRLQKIADHLRTRTPMVPPITTHVLDTARGAPAEGVPVRLERVTPAGAQTLSEVITNDDGRVDGGVVPAGTALRGGTYRITFDTAAYYARTGGDFFYPEVQILFQLPAAPDEHYHIPLLLSPFGYSTYRGS